MTWPNRETLFAVLLFFPAVATIYFGCRFIWVHLGDKDMVTQVQAGVMAGAAFVFLVVLGCVGVVAL